MTEAHPAEDCYSLKNTSSKFTSGFYWVLPPCSSKPLRAYCDIHHGGTYFVLPDNDGIISVADSVKKCAEYGLSAVHLHSHQQAGMLKHMLDLMEMDYSLPIPIAINNGANRFYSLDMQKDVTEFIVEAQKGGALVSNTVGLSQNGLVFFDSSQNDMSAIMCSTNYDVWKPPQAFMNVACSTTIKGNTVFDGPSGTHFFIKCPERCLDSAIDAPLIGGDDGVYSDDSSICLAAIHSGEELPGGEASLKIVSSPREFSGSDKNGVVADSYIGPPKERAFLIGPAVRQCPIDNVGSLTRDTGNTQSQTLETKNIPMAGVLAPQTGEHPHQLPETMGSGTTSMAVPLKQPAVGHPVILPARGQPATHSTPLDHSALLHSPTLSGVDVISDSSAAHSVSDHYNPQSIPGIYGQQAALMSETPRTSSGAYSPPSPAPETHRSPTQPSTNKYPENRRPPYTNFFHIYQPTSNSYTTKTLGAGEPKRRRDVSSRFIALPDIKPNRNSPQGNGNGSTALTTTPSEDLNEATSSCIDQLRLITDKRLGGMDADILEHIEATAMKSVYSARSIIKPAETLEKELLLVSGELLSRMRHFVDHLKQSSTKIMITMTNANGKLREAIADRARQSAPDDWNAAGFSGTAFSDIFMVENSRTAVGYGDWHLGPIPIGGRQGKHILSQTTAVSAAVTGSTAIGTYAIVRDKSFYDFIFSVDVYISGSGSVGVAFRVKDHMNLFLFEMRQTHGGSKRLLRVVEGAPVEIARIDDGGYVEGQWHTIRIEAVKERIRVTVLEKNEELLMAAPRSDIDVLDGSFVSGTVGFFTSGINAAYFDEAQVLSHPCAKRSVDPPPMPHVCSNYRESFVDHFSSEWYVVDPPQAFNGPSRWKFMSNVAGEHKTIVQMSGIWGGVEDTPTMALLGNHRTCDNGSFTFKFLPQCEGVVGAVFRFKDENNFMLFEMGTSFAKLRQKVAGTFSTRGKSLLSGYAVGKWTTLSLKFIGENVIVTAGNGSIPIPIFNAIGTGSLGISDERSGKVGLATWNCAGVAFADLTLHPLDESAIEAESVKKEFPLFRQNTVDAVKPVNVCMDYQPLKNRMSYCDKKNKRMDERIKCGENFCFFCCKNEMPHSDLAQKTCERECDKKNDNRIASFALLSQIKEECKTDWSVIYSPCANEKKKKQCREEVCGMCCATFKIPLGVSNEERELIQQTCKELCNNETNNGE